MMQPVDYYQLVFLDLDGLLVNTEELHYEAYREMCRRRGYALQLSFPAYCEIAHRSAKGLREMIYQQFPSLLKEEPRWELLYAEKKQAFIDLITRGAVQLMPGAAELLRTLKRVGVKRCVVTHSAKILVDTIRAQNAILDTIPHWLTREDYTHPKPDPDCYRTAMTRLATPGDRIIGFEDTPRGLEALKGIPAQRVFICQKTHTCFPTVVEPDVLHFESLTALPKTWLS